MHLGVSRSGYYDWLARPVSERAQQDAELLRHIKRIFLASKERYGSPKVFQALRHEGIRVGKKRVARLMRAAGLKARVERVYRRMLKRRQVLRALPNHRLDIDKPTKPNQQWSGDVTYIRHGKRFFFLAVFLDLYSRKVVGWALAKEVNATLVITALKRAVKTRRPKQGLMLHTDRGIEYRALNTQSWLNHFGITHSMSRPGCCTDNAEVESFFKSLKSELIHQSHWADIHQLQAKIKRYIERFYNRERLHSSLEYLSPVQFENRI